MIHHSPCVEIGELKKLTSRELFLEKSFDFTSTKSKEIIDYFNSTRTKRYGIGGTLPAEYTHEYQKINKEWYRKYITIGVKGDLVIVVLKYVNMFGNVYNRIEGCPISITNNRENEIKVLISLFNNQLTNKIGCVKKEGDELEKIGFVFTDKIISYNFYSHIPTNYEEISKNKWRTKNGVNRMLAMKNLSWKLLNNETDIDKIKIVNKGFDRWKMEIEGTDKGWHNLSKKSVQYPYWDEDDGVNYYLFSYKDIPIGLAVYIFPNGKLAHQIIKKSLGHLLYEDGFIKLNEKESNEFDELGKRLGNYIHYITVKDLYEMGIEDGYFGGSFSMKSLRTHKGRMNDLEISHYNYKMN